MAIGKHKDAHPQLHLFGATCEKSKTSERLKKRAIRWNDKLLPPAVRVGGRASAVRAASMSVVGPAARPEIGRKTPNFILQSSQLGFYRLDHWIWSGIVVLICRMKLRRSFGMF